MPLVARSFPAAIRVREQPEKAGADAFIAALRPPDVPEQLDLPDEWEQAPDVSLSCALLKQLV